MIKKKKKWLTKGQVPIRIFHQSRVTKHKIYELKDSYFSEFKPKALSSNLRKKKKIIKVDKIINIVKSIIGNFIFIFIYSKRIFSQKKYNFVTAFHETFLKKKKLIKLIKGKKND